MFLIIFSLAAINIYGYIYSQALFFSPRSPDGQSTCSFTFPPNYRAYNFFSITNRITIYCLWTIPIIYVFWPANKTWYGAEKSSLKRKESAIYERNQNILLHSGNDQNNELSKSKESIRKSNHKSRNSANGSSSSSEDEGAGGMGGSNYLPAGQQFILRSTSDKLAGEISGTQTKSYG